jgi:hypothetical protein
MQKALNWLGPIAESLIFLAIAASDLSGMVIAMVRPTKESRGNVG